MFLDGRPRRIKGSGDHRWTEWADTPIGRPRTCLDCGRIDDGYQQPCEKETTDRTHRKRL